MGRDDFDKASELMGGSLNRRKWGVCEEYELKRLADAPEGYIPPYILVSAYPRFRPHHDRWRTYAPLEDTPDLFLRFARLHDRGDQIEAMVDWVHTYGVLGYEDERGPRSWDTLQSAKDFKESVYQAARILRLYEAVLNGDSEQARAAIFDEWLNDRFWRDVYNSRTNKHSYTFQEWITEHLSEVVEDNFGGDYLEYALVMAAKGVERMVSNHCTPLLSVEEGSHDPSGVTATWTFRNLLGAMYLQMYWLMGSGGNVTRCQYCGRIISLASPLPGARKTRQDKKFCDDACRQRHHYHTKTKLRRQGKSQQEQP